jgi:hypothetical protein
MTSCGKALAARCVPAKRRASRPPDARCFTSALQCLPDDTPKHLKNTECSDETRSPSGAPTQSPSAAAMS